MARGAPRKWSAVSAVAPLQAETLDQFEKDVLGYILFALAQNMDLGPDLVVAYAASQELAGLCLIAIANRVEMIRRLTWNNVTSVLTQHRISRKLAHLRRSYTNAGGPKRKILASVMVLSSWLCRTPVLPRFRKGASYELRDLSYQVLWFICCAVGCRPEETRTLKYRYSNGALSIQWNGRKNAPVSGACFYRFESSLFSVAPSQVAGWLVEGKPLPHFGKQAHLATNMNSWLRKYHERRGLVCPGLHVTSTCPRLRLDNVLRDLVDSGCLSVPVYEAMIGHTVRVSDLSYRR